jgi:hypothetical protein
MKLFIFNTFIFIDYWYVKLVILLNFALNLIYGNQIPYYEHSSAISMEIPSLSGSYLSFYSILSTSLLFWSTVSTSLL